ncbi:MAG: NAD(P)/FAD-dependent oxidoreductase [Bdellovibrionales bacterium]|nr:NAD(P)/FAD-dependent oxidoreductase [Bdellovibrionales bacterium]
MAATELRRLLPKEDRVIVIDRESDHLFAPSLLWLMIGDRRPEQIRRSVSALTQKGIEVVRGEIESIDPDTRKITVGGKTLSADALIVSLGAEYNEDAIPGLKKAGHNLYTLPGATGIRNALRDFRGGRVVILTAAPAYKCPAAPYEAALLVDYQLSRLGLSKTSEVAIYAAEPGPMLTAGPEVSAAVKQMVETRGIKYFPGHQVKEVDPAQKRIHFGNGVVAPFDLLVYVPPHRAPQAVRDTKLTEDSGWIAPDRHTFATRFPGVYAIGDVTTVPLKSGRPLPKAGVFTHGQAEVVAHNIASEWAGRPDRRSYDGQGQCFIEIGHHRAGVGAGNFYAEPAPEVKVKPPGLRWHAGKVLFEKYWLWKWF